ncbi:hypothetical protein KPH14_008659 [Odynerus spinipes]|uniref:Uncharacterized protein n=1 Tax=Odynerus spinipes TaxID=1348599 RepID=A0AAD9VT61_9HYME|nr:hypothetical protein KPH14_008659 [Odynerus spinipes]
MVPWVEPQVEISTRTWNILGNIPEGLKNAFGNWIGFRGKSVNVSREFFLPPDFPDRVYAILRTEILLDER